MELGLVIYFEKGGRSGSLLLSDGEVLPLRYRHGESVALEAGDQFPKLSGNHSQPSGYALKHPEPGDALIVLRDSAKPPRWGYLDSWIACSKRLAAAN